MTAPTIYLASGEDDALILTGGASIDTTTGHFRSVARCAIALSVGSSGQPPVQTLVANYPSAISSFWQSIRNNSSAAAGTYNTFNGTFAVATWSDASGIGRLQIRNTAGLSPTLAMYKVNAAGAATQLGATFGLGWAGGATVDKLDIQINYAVAGSIKIYLNNVLLYSFSGDVTTDSNTTLSSTSYSAWGVNSGTPPTFRLSELIVSDTDTRSWGLATITAVSNGNTHNFDTGTPAAANINEITRDDSTYDASSVAGQIDQYTPSAMPSGFQPVAFGVSAYAAKGAAGPSQMYLGVRSGGADYWSSAIALAPSLQTYQNWWATDPATGLPWTGNPTNFGAESVT